MIYKKMNILMNLTKNSKMGMIISPTFRDSCQPWWEWSQVANMEESQRGDNRSTDLGYV